MTFEEEQKLVKELREYVTKYLPLSELKDEELEPKIEEIVQDRLRGKYCPIEQRLNIITQIYSSLRGYGLLDSIMNDDSITEVMINGPKNIFIELNKTPFRIDRERRSVDYAITGNPTISKKHIEVRFEKGEFQVYDEDSLNHTYINGKRIPKKTWSRIRTGDILRLNNEEFECKLN